MLNSYPFLLHTNLAHAFAWLASFVLQDPNDFLGLHAWSGQLSVPSDHFVIPILFRINLVKMLSLHKLLYNIFLLFDNLFKMILLQTPRLQESLSVDCPLHTPPPISFTNLARVRVFVPSPQVVEHVSHSLQVPQTQSTAAIYVENYYWKLKWSSLNFNPILGVFLW